MKDFRDFKENFNFDALYYDIKRIAPKSLLKENKAFTREQYEMIVNTTVTTLLGVLEQYHDWNQQEQP